MTDKKVMRVLMCNGGIMDGKDLFCVNWGPGELREYEGDVYERTPDGVTPIQAIYLGRNTDPEVLDRLQSTS